MKTRYKIGLTVVALLACAFYVFQLPHGGTINALTADDGDDIPLTTEGYIDYPMLTKTDETASA